jgi:hypothetical protein
MRVYVGHTFLPPAYVTCPLYPPFLETVCRKAVAVVVVVLVG